MNTIEENNIKFDFYMEQAIKEAKKADQSDDIPIGCVIVHKKRIIARAHNQVELLKDATAHAEMIAITQAESYLNDWRLNDAVLFVTKEPCPMCAGAILQSRIGTVVYGVSAPRDGAAGSVINLLNSTALGSSVECIGEVKEKKCRDLLQEFFKRIRKKSKEL
ncbi:MAG: nucleoside deaminase [Candidatus Euphemobacter frigidus]|nr:nucleoside deaminase [Candidatus Euphemobacter frigidus]